MSSIRRPMACAALAFAAALACAGDEPEPKAQSVMHVPMKSVHLTFNQKGTNLVTSNDAKHGADAWASKMLTWARSGATNVFLVRGNTVEDAAEATHEVLRRGKSADVPGVPTKGAEGQPYWLVAMLGRQPESPSAWHFRSATRHGKIIRLDVEKPRLDGTDKGRHIYLAWVPLGNLPDGTYRLELYVNSEAEPELVRRVAVSKKDDH